MALPTFGTTAATSLSGLVGNSTSQTNVAALAALITDDYTGIVNPSGWMQGTSGGLLYVPRRGVLKVFAGDWIGVDGAGWPILVSANSIANSTWVHNP